MSILDWLKSIDEENQRREKERERARNHYLFDDIAPSNKPTKFYKCPKCYYAIRSVENNSLRCGNCGRLIIIQNGRVTGWR